MHEGNSVTIHGAGIPDSAALKNSANERWTKRMTPRQQLYDSAPGLYMTERPLSRSQLGDSPLSRRNSDSLRDSHRSDTSNTSVRVLFDMDGLPKLDVSVNGRTNPMTSINTVHGGSMIKDHLDLRNRYAKAPLVNRLASRWHCCTRLLLTTADVLCAVQRNEKQPVHGGSQSTRRKRQEVVVKSTLEKDAAARGGEACS